MLDVLKRMFMIGRVPMFVSIIMMVVLGAFFVMCLTAKKNRPFALLSIAFILGTLYWMSGRF